MSDGSDEDDQHVNPSDSGFLGLIASSVDFDRSRDIEKHGAATCCVSSIAENMLRRLFSSAKISHFVLRSAALLL